MWAWDVLADYCLTNEETCPIELFYNVTFINEKSHRDEFNEPDRLKPQVKHACVSTLGRDSSSLFARYSPGCTGNKSPNILPG